MANPPPGPSFDWKMYRYTPSLVAAILFLALFTILTLLHVYSYTRSRRTSIIYIILGGLCEIAGFGARIGSHFDNTAWAPFIIQGTLLLVGPLFFAATVYMMLGRTVRCAGADEVSRGLGASLMGTMQLRLALAGEKVVIAGLALQVATFVVFLVAAIDFHVRLNCLLRVGQGADDLVWKEMLYVLYALSTLILFRCVFRLIEYAMGNAAYLIAHEWALYVFDGVPMLAVLLVLFIWQPKEMDALQKSESEESNDGELGIIVSR
ncbi:hypothetical protein E8E12_003341 [Didymella heteroderae]|uniref:Uncharacterized protein n=1 Tax=Didymella heteroderae TaxID=1769908 RepID=A0A9P4WHX6_9PLEO|nr:hypothetical protein E8E12_003341 [Didymella heteroderae]